MLLRIGIHGCIEKGDRGLGSSCLTKQHTKTMIGNGMMWFRLQHVAEQTLRFP